MSRTPPEHRVEQLKRYDHRLEFRWGHAAQRWEVWYDDKRGPAYMVCRVMGDRGEYRDIDERVFTRLYMSDRLRFRTAKKHLDAIDDKFNRRRERAAKRLEDYTRDFADGMAWGIKRDFA